MAESRSDGHDPTGQGIIPMSDPAVMATAPNAGVGPIIAAGQSVTATRDTITTALPIAAARLSMFNERLMRPYVTLVELWCQGTLRLPL